MSVNQIQYSPGDNHDINIQVKDLYVTGTSTYSGNIDITGNLHVTGTSSLDGTIKTSIIQPAIPNASLVILPNGIGNVFDCQLAISRFVSVESDLISSKTVGADLVLSGNGAGKIIANDDLYPGVFDTYNLGNTSNRWLSVEGLGAKFDNIGSSSLGSNLVLSGISGVVLNASHLKPGTTDLYNLGDLTNRWLAMESLSVKSDTIQNSTPATNLTLTASAPAHVKLGRALEFPTGGALLDHYSEFISSGNKFTGPWAVDISSEYSVGRVGQLCCLKVPFVTGVATISAPITNTSLLPADYRPLLTITGPIVILDNAVQSVGVFTLDNTGLLTITLATGASFSGLGLSGIPQSFCLGYSLL